MDITPGTLVRLKPTTNFLSVSALQRPWVSGKQPPVLGIVSTREVCLVVSVVQTLSSEAWLNLLGKGWLEASLFEEV